MEKHPNIKDSYYWRKSNTNKILMTVAIPLKNMSKIVQIALESLVNQTDVKHLWELLVWDDQMDSFNIINQYVGKFPNCVQIVYKNCPPKTLLIDKWIEMAQMASKSSYIFVLQAGDDYSPPQRLSIHYQHFSKNKDCWASGQKLCPFINLQQDLILYDASLLDPKYKLNHINMAYHIKDIKSLPSINRNSRIDSHLYRTIKKKYPNLDILWADDIKEDIWKYSFDTHGYNQISKSRDRFWINIKPPYRSIPQDYDLKQHFPPRVIQLLSQLMG